MITYLEGDATQPQADGPAIIAHVCNDIGVWGKGFVLAVSSRWPQVRAEYRSLGRPNHGFALGTVQFVPVEPAVTVANMIAQRDIRCFDAIPPIRYDALAECLEQVAARASELGASVHMPRIGCGLAGSSWELIEPLVRSHLTDSGVETFVYDLPRPAERGVR